MHIWVDADACPGAIKEILYRAAERAQLPMTLVANKPLAVPRSSWIRSLQVLQAVCHSGQSLAQLLHGVSLFPQTLINVRLAPDVDWKSNRTLASEQEAVQRELADSGRVLIRASGTEPLLRVMVEASDPELARGCAERLARAARA